MIRVRVLVIGGLFCLAFGFFIGRFTSGEAGGKAPGLEDQERLSPLFKCIFKNGDVVQTKIANFKGVIVESHRQPKSDPDRFWYKVKFAAKGGGFTTLELWEEELVVDPKRRKKSEAREKAGADDPYGNHSTY